jgi:hypothetical protein
MNKNKIKYFTNTNITSTKLKYLQS